MTSPKVLIVDDEPNILILMEQVLEELEESAGVEIWTARDGEAALAVIDRERPQLVFLDVMMPKISGLEVCRQTKQNPDYQGIYIILLTAKGQEYDREMGLEVGADCYITKPFRPRDIVQKTRQVLGL
ncbi:MAG: response regulator [Cyanobacteriota bacterium]|jgi:two-component system alkaline phosphatase synthesis response regulator PhoP